MAISSVGSPGLTITPRLPANETPSGTRAPESTTSTRAPTPAAASSATGTASLSNQLSPNLQAYLLQLQGSSATNVSTRPTQSSGADTGTDATSGVSQRRPHRGDADIQETGSPEQSPTLAAGDGPSSAPAAAGSASLNAGGSILAALEAYASASGENQPGTSLLFA